jgi:hypothetical protein
MQQLAKQVNSPRLVVDVADQGVLDRHSPTGPIRVTPRRRKHFLDLPPRVDRHQSVPQLIVSDTQFASARGYSGLRPPPAPPGRLPRGEHVRRRHQRGRGQPHLTESEQHEGHPNP